MSLEENEYVIEREHERVVAEDVHIAVQMRQHIKENTR